MTRLKEEALANSVPVAAVRRGGGGQVFFGMTGCKGHVGGVKSGDLRRNAKSEGSSLGPYRRWSAKAWGANEIRYPGSPCRAAWLSPARVVRCLVKSYNKRNPRFVLLRHTPKEKVFATKVTMTSSWQRRKTRHSGEPPSGVVRSGFSTPRQNKTAPKQTKRCVPHSRGTASDILEEGGDDVKSAWPLWAGPHMCYNGNYNGKQGLIADQHAAVNMYPGPVHTARHTLGIGFARSIRPMITHDFCVPLVPQRLLVVLLAHTTVGSSTGVKS
ncbi:hypothetical protein AB3S75_033446 [Citrus x aurantiifolia]